MISPMAAQAWPDLKSSNPFELNAVFPTEKEMFFKVKECQKECALNAKNNGWAS